MQTVAPTPRRLPFPTEKLGRILAHPSIGRTFLHFIYEKEPSLKGFAALSFLLRHESLKESPGRKKVWWVGMDIGSLSPVNRKLCNPLSLSSCLLARTLASPVNPESLKFLASFLDISRIFNAARDVTAADCVVRQYWDNPNSRLFACPKDCVKLILRFVFWDSTVEQEFNYRPPLP